MLLKSSNKFAPYRIFFARRLGSIDGVLSVVDTRSGLKVFNRLPARSGLITAVKNELITKKPNGWVRGSSPVPMLSELGGKGLFVHLQRPLQEGQWAGLKGIGEFWHISNTEDNVRLTRNPLTGQERWDLGGHPENKFKGSNGCTVLLNETEKQKAEVERLSRFLKSLIGAYQFVRYETIELIK